MLIRTRELEVIDGELFDLKRSLRELVDLAQPSLVAPFTDVIDAARRVLLHSEDTIHSDDNHKYFDEVVCQAVQSYGGGGAWTREGLSAWYSSRSGEDEYALNPVTGLLLLNGHPICELPEAMRRDRLFQRTMKEFHFKVRPEGHSFKTSEKVEGADYCFGWLAEVLLPFYRVFS